MALGLIACSNGASKSDIASDPELKQQYNADLERLHKLLDTAKSLDSQIEAMEPINQHDAAEVSEYNSLVDQYNDVADQYRSAAKKFNEKYSTHAEGASGNKEVNPDQIDLPDYID